MSTYLDSLAMASPALADALARRDRETATASGTVVADAWVTSQLRLGALAGALRSWEARQPLPAYRSAIDDAWVARQLATRREYVRRLAPSLGLDPDEAVRALGLAVPAAVAR